MKFKALPINDIITYEVNIVSCVNHIYSHETFTFFALSEAKAYISSDYQHNKLNFKDNLNYYCANIVRKAECVMFKSEMEENYDF